MPASPQPNLYIGRFAPTPSGPLHSGSLVAALASFLDARSAQGKWLIRIENTDPPREQPGASAEILHALEAHNLFWDDKVTYQSQRTAIYKAATNTLLNQQLGYYCTCSRLQLKGHSIYPGTCRQQRTPPSSPSAIRVLCNDINIEFNDHIQGPQSHPMNREIGDFIIYRKDDLPAYQLATAVDDIEQGITHVMRGCDLLDSTPRQMYLHYLLGMKSPSYAHIPVLAKEDGQKLSKQNLARPLDLNRCNDNLFQALQLLEQAPPKSLQHQSSQDILDWAIRHWTPKNIPSIAVIKKDRPDF
ncbi:MAG: tRNA glutamyl-Q(34) synthetase GluQRS [Pseudomonadales bacterium]